ncbi:MAG TPA: pyridoxamine 5'-phosphate oxidase [Natronosporangium sp.]
MTHDPPDPAALRREYETTGLSEEQLAEDWPTQFGRWFTDAVTARIAEPNAMTLATVDDRGRPSARTVLLKHYDERGFVCYTNLKSRKATEALRNPYASLVFCWLALHRQVVVCGAVEPVSRAETEAYFAQRPRGAQLGAWASPQSQVIASRQELDRRYAEAAARFPEGTPVPAPPHWGGLRIVPETVEFWQGRPDRLHDRLRYRRVTEGSWVVERLGP